MLHRQLLPWQSSVTRANLTSASRWTSQHLNADHHHVPSQHEMQYNELAISSRRLYAFLWRTSGLPTCATRQPFHTGRRRLQSSSDDLERQPSPPSQPATDDDKTTDQTNNDTNAKPADNVQTFIRRYASAGPLRPIAKPPANHFGGGTELTDGTYTIRKIKIGPETTRKSISDDDDKDKEGKHPQSQTRSGKSAEKDQDAGAGAGAATAAANAAAAEEWLNERILPFITGQSENMTDKKKEVPGVEKEPRIKKTRHRSLSSRANTKQPLLVSQAVGNTSLVRKVESASPYSAIAEIYESDGLEHWKRSQHVRQSRERAERKDALKSSTQESDPTSAPSQLPSNTIPRRRIPGTGMFVLPRALGNTPSFRSSFSPVIFPFSASALTGRKEKQHLLLFFTPALASQLLGGNNNPSELLSRVVQRMFYRELHHNAMDNLRVGMAVVDKLPVPPRAWDGVADGSEGIAYALVDDISFVENSAPSDSSNNTNKLVTLRLETMVGTREGHLEGYEIQVPLANTIFQAGQENILQVWDWKNKKRTGARSPFGLRSAIGRTPTSVTATIKLANIATKDIIKKVSTPLRALTQPRIVEASMGNIIRQLRTSDDGEILRASAELEEAINSMVALATLPPGPAAVWALIVKESVYERLVRQQIPLPSVPSPQPDDGLQSRDTGLSGLYAEEPSAPPHPDLTAILREGGRLHRVMSGGGGWGKKAGLLSISPAVGFEKAPKDLGSGDSAPPWMEQFKEMSQVLGSPVEQGDRIQFFLAMANSENANKPAQSDAHGFDPLRPSLTIQIGAIPSSIDAMPVISDPSSSDLLSSRAAEFFPGFFGVLSEKGFSISGKDDAGDETKTMIDVPFSRLTARRAPTEDSREAIEEVKNIESDPSEAELHESADENGVWMSRIRKVQHSVENPTRGIRYHIRVKDNPESARDYRRALQRTRKVRAEVEARTRDLKEAVTDSHLMNEVLEIALENGNPENRVKEGMVTRGAEATEQQSKSDPRSASSLTQAQQDYTDKLASLSDGEYEQEKFDLGKAIKRAKAARRQAIAAIKKAELPSSEHDVVPAPETSEGSGMTSIDKSASAISRIKNMDFDQLSGRFLELKASLEYANGEPKSRQPSEDTKTKFWSHHGFSRELVAMLTEYHSLHGEIPEAALSVFKESFNGLLELPFAQLREAAKKLSPEKERQFWRRWKLVRRLGRTIRSEARADFETNLVRRAKLDNYKLQVATEQGLQAESAVVKENPDELDDSFRAMMFIVLGQGLRVPFQGKDQFWTNQGLPLDIRGRLLTSPATRSLMHTMFQWLTRINYQTGDAVGATLAEGIAWNSAFSKSARFTKLKFAEPKLHIKYDSGDTEELIQNGDGVPLLYKPRRTYEKLMDEEHWRTFSERHPWEFLYRFLTYWPKGDLPERISLKRSQLNDWHMKLKFKNLRNKLGVIFTKFDEAINAHGSQPGLAEVDIGKEIRELFPTLLRTQMDLMTELKIQRQPELPSTVTSGRPLFRRVEIGGRASNVKEDSKSFIRYQRTNDPLLKSVALPNTLSKGFESKWETNPNIFAFELMEKRMRRRLQERIEARAAAKTERDARPDMLEGEGEKDFDYDMEERRLERILEQQRGGPQAFKRLDLERENVPWDEPGEGETASSYTPLVDSIPDEMAVRRVTSVSPVDKPVDKPVDEDETLSDKKAVRARILQMLGKI